MRPGHHDPAALGRNLCRPHRRHRRRADHLLCPFGRRVRLAGQQVRLDRLGALVLTGRRSAAFCLPQHQQDFLSTHSPYGRTLLARAQRGHPHARYRAALLLARDPALTQEALGLLIDVASTGHPLALDLQDDGREASQAAGPAGGLSPRTAAQRLWDLARTAWAYGADSQPYAFCRAAARGGIPDAMLALARVRLTDIDPEAAQWLGQLGAEATVGRHHAS